MFQNFSLCYFHTKSQLTIFLTCSLEFLHQSIRLWGKYFQIRWIQEKTKTKWTKWTFWIFGNLNILIPNLDSAGQKTSRKWIAKVSDGRKSMCLKWFIWIFADFSDCSFYSPVRQRRALNNFGKLQLKFFKLFYPFRFFRLKFIFWETLQSGTPAQLVLWFTSRSWCFIFWDVVDSVTIFRK